LMGPELNVNLKLNVYSQTSVEARQHAAEVLGSSLVD
jgi:hypothetical protein